MGDQTAFDRMARALSNPYRRQLLVGLTEHNPQAVEDYVDVEHALASTNVVLSAETVYIELIHNHLPKLEKYGYIRRNESTGEISVGPNWEEIEPLLRLLQTHEEHLPADWLENTP